jgi:hypothetical protein
MGKGKTPMRKRDDLHGDHALATWLRANGWTGDFRADRNANVYMVAGKDIAMVIFGGSNGTEKSVYTD